jgi:hypothetical protein
MGRKGLIRVSIIFMLLLSQACDSNKNEGVKNDSTIDKIKYTELLEDFLNELSSIDNWDNTKDVFYKYYYEPDSLMEGELIEVFLWDFERFWLSVKDKPSPYLKTVYYPIYGKELENSPYGLTVIKNKTCDYCIVLQPNDNMAVEYFCFKKGKIYSTIGTYDIDKEEYIWYRYKKHPPMRFY